MTLLRSNVPLLPVHVRHVLAHIPQNEPNRLVKVRHVPHLELRPISKEEDHVAIAEQSLHGANLHHVGVHDLGHILPANAGRHADATVGNRVPNPRLARPRGGGGDDADDGEDGDGRGDGLGDGGRSLVECFFGREGGEGFGWGCGRCRFSALSFPSLGLYYSVTRRVSGWTTLKMSYQRMVRTAHVD